MTLLDPKCKDGRSPQTVTGHRCSKGRRSSPEQSRAPALGELVSGVGDRQSMNTCVMYSFVSWSQVVMRALERNKAKRSEVPWVRVVMFGWVVRTET